MTIKEYITRRGTGFERDDGAARYIYDRDGKYLGQYQVNCLDTDGSGPPELWFATHPGDKCYHELTEKQMEEAT
jgi:hypothetical protein